MAKKRKARKRTPNPASPSFRTGRLVPVKAVRVNKHGVLQQVVVEDRETGEALTERARSLPVSGYSSRAQRAPAGERRGGADRYDYRDNHRHTGRWPDVGCAGRRGDHGRDTVGSRGRGAVLGM